MNEILKWFCIVALVWGALYTLTLPTISAMYIPELLMTKVPDFHQFLIDSSTLIGAVIAASAALIVVSKQNEDKLIREKAKFYGYLYNYFCQGQGVLDRIDERTFYEIKRTINENCYLAEKDLMTPLSRFNEGTIITIPLPNNTYACRKVSEEKFSQFSEAVRTGYTQFKEQLEGKKIFS